MKKLIFITLALLITNAASSQTKYPIKTIFKGDSVVIISVQQSAQINAAISKATKNSAESREKMQAKDAEIEKMKLIITEQNVHIDSLSNALLEYLNKETVSPDSLWKWSLGPTLIYTQYPEDSAVYLMDLSHYYMTTDDFGIIMVRMSDKEYAKYLDFNSKYGMSEEAFWQFRSDMRIKTVSDEEMKERRVWKYKRKEK